MRPLGSEIFQTQEIRTDEALIYIKAAIENGSSTETAYNDIHLIDNLFMVKRFHLATRGYMKLTWRGNARKNQTLSDALEAVIDACVTEEMEKKSQLNP